MTNKTYTITLNDGTTLNNVNTKHWPCYEYDGVLDRQKLESNISKVTILRDNGIKYILKDKMLDQYMITSQNTTLFNFKGQYDFLCIDECQKYTVKFKNGTRLENVVIIKSPYYEYNAIIEKDILEDNLYEVIVLKNNNNLYKLDNPALISYSVKNGHTLFQLCNQYVEDEIKTYKLTLADGTELDDVNMRYYPYYEYEDIIEKHEIEYNLSSLTIKDDKGNTETYSDKILCDYYIRNGHTLFQL